MGPHMALCPHKLKLVHGAEICQHMRTVHAYAPRIGRMPLWPYARIYSSQLMGLKFARICAPHMTYDVRTMAAYAPRIGRMPRMGPHMARCPHILKSAHDAEMFPHMRPAYDV